MSYQLCTAERSADGTQLSWDGHGWVARRHGGLMPQERGRYQLKTILVREALAHMKRFPTIPTCLQ